MITYLLLFLETLFYLGIDSPPYESLHEGDAATYVFPELYSQAVLPRVPVYSLLIKLLKILLDTAHLSQGIVIVQVIVYYISVFFFYKLCTLLWNGISDKISFLCTLCYGCLPGLICYNKAVRVEALSIALFVIYLWVLAKIILGNGKLLYGFIGGVFPGILILLRPSFLFLVVIGILCGGAIYKIQKKSLKGYLVGGMVSVLLLLGQCCKNYNDNRVFALTDISTFNQLVICFDTGLYKDNIDLEIVKEWELSQNAKEIYEKFGEERCQKFIYSTYIEHIPGFILYNFKKLCNIGSTSLFIHGTPYVSERICWKENFWGQICQNGSKLFSFFNFSFLYFLMGIMFFVNVMKKTRGSFNIILWLCVTLQFATGFLGAQNEWARMIVPSIPILIIWMGEFFNTLMVDRKLLVKANDQRIKDKFELEK